MTHALSIVLVTCQSVMQCQITLCGFIFCYQSNLVLDFDTGMIWWKYVGPEGKVAKALSHHWPSEHHPPLFLFPPCPHSSTQLLLFDTHPTSDRQRWDVPLRTCKTFILWTVFPNVTHFLISSVGPVSRLRVSCHQKCGRLSTHKCFPRPSSLKCPNCRLLAIFNFPEVINGQLGTDGLILPVP